MDNPHCSCELTRFRRLLTQSAGPAAVRDDGEAAEAAATVLTNIGSLVRTLMMMI